MVTIEVKEFGAVGDGIQDDTAAFEAAIRQIEKHGGGRVIVDIGEYLIRPINLTSHMILHLSSDVRILGMADERRWPLIPGVPSYGRGRDRPGYRYTSLLHGEHLTNVTIEGESRASSVIDGNGPYWYEMRRQGRDAHTRGHLVEFLYSSQLKFRTLLLKDSPFWTNHLFDCDDVHYQDVAIHNPTYSYNTDGWDPDSSRNVLIEDSSYYGGDDCVAVKSGWDCLGIDYGKPSANITIRNVTCGGPRAGGIALGSEMSGGIENVLVENVTFLAHVNKPINIKAGDSRGGYIRNVTYRNIEVRGVVQEAAIFIDMFRYLDPGSHNPLCPPNWKAPLPIFENFVIENMNGRKSRITSNETFRIVGHRGSPIRNISLRDVYFHKPVNPQGVGWNCSHISDSYVVKHSVTPWPPKSCSGLHVVPSRKLSSSWFEKFMRLSESSQYLGWFLALVCLCLCWWFTSKQQPKETIQKNGNAVF